MQFEDIIVDYYLELETPQEKITVDPTLFDSDKQNHGYTCSCCSRAVNERHEY